MSTYKGTIKKWKTVGTVWDVLYPQTTIDQVIDLSTELSNMQADIDDKIPMIVATAITGSIYTQNLEKHKTYYTSGATTVYVDADSEGGSYALGDTITFVRNNSGYLRFYPSGGTIYRNIDGTALTAAGYTYVKGQFQAATLIKTGTNIWTLIGALSTS